MKKEKKKQSNVQRGKKVADLRHAEGAGGHWLEFRRTLGAHLEHVNLTSHSIQPAWLSSFLSLQEIQSNKLGSVKGAVRGSSPTVARKEVPALKADSGNL